MPLLSPQRHGQDGLSSPWHSEGVVGHPCSRCEVALENISLLFQPPECVALAQAENPLCPVLGVTSRGSGQLCTRHGAGCPELPTLPHSPLHLGSPCLKHSLGCSRPARHTWCPLSCNKPHFTPAALTFPVLPGFRGTPCLL